MPLTDRMVKQNMGVCTLEYCSITWRPQTIYAGRNKHENLKSIVMSKINKKKNVCILIFICQNTWTKNSNRYFTLNTLE